MGKGKGEKGKGEKEAASASSDGSENVAELSETLLAKPGSKAPAMPADPPSPGGPKPITTPAAAAFALFALATRGESKRGDIATTALPNLLQVVDKPPDADARHAALGCIYTLATSPEGAENYVEQLTLPKFVDSLGKILTGTHDRSKMFAAAILRSMSTNAERASRLTGQVMPLVTIIMQKEPGWAGLAATRAHAAHALANIVQLKPPASPALPGSLPPPSPGKSGSAPAGEDGAAADAAAGGGAAARASQLAAAASDPRALVMVSGAVNSLVYLIRTGSQEEQRGAALVLAALCAESGILLELASDRETIAVFVDALVGAGEAVAAGMSGVLASLVTEEAYWKEMIRAGIIPQIAKILNPGPDPLEAAAAGIAAAEDGPGGGTEGKEKKGKKDKKGKKAKGPQFSPEQETCMRNAAIILQKLTLAPELRVHIAESGAVKPLCEMLDGGLGVEAFRCAAAALTNLGADQVCVPFMVAADAPAYVITPVRKAKNLADLLDHADEEDIPVTLPKEHGTPLKAAQGRPPSVGAVAATADGGVSAAGEAGKGGGMSALKKFSTAALAAATAAMMVKDTEKQNAISAETLRSDPLLSSV